MRGRQEEHRLVLELLTSATPHHVVIEGEPGIGKTTLWAAAVDRLRATTAIQLLQCRPAQEEMAVAATALVDLFDRVEPAPGLLDRDADPFDRGRAALETLRRLTARGPVVLAIDDLQWLDPVTAQALRYAMRRLVDEDVRILATRRPAVAGPTPGWPVDDLARPGRLRILTLGALPLQAIRQAVAVVVQSIPRPALERIHLLSGGNPMHAVELARCVDAAGNSPADPLGGPSPVSLRTTVRSRLGSVDPALTELLRVAAALGPSPVALLIVAHGTPGAAGLLGEAVAAGLLLVGEGRSVRPAHPMLADEVLAGLDPAGRRDLHARLAALVPDPDARARHLALSWEQPDEQVAVLLAEAADRAARRGGHAVAADLAGQCLLATPPGDVATRDRRALAEIAYRAAAGETGRALDLTDKLLEQLPAGRDRAAAVTQRVFLDLDAGAEFLLHQLADAAGDPAARGRILELLGWLLGTFRGELALAQDYGWQALRIGRDVGDGELEMLAAATVATMSMLTARPRPELMDRAMELAAEHRGPRLGRRPQVFLGRLCLWSGDLGQARTLFDGMRATFAAAGVEFQRPYRLNDLALVELAAGNLFAARDLTDEAVEAATDAGNRQAVLWVSYAAGLVAAHLGDRAQAMAAADRLTDAGSTLNLPPRTLMGQHIEGVLQLTAGEPAAALTVLVRAVELADGLGYRCPGFIPLVPDAIEAAALVGDTGTAQRLAAALDEQAAGLRTPWAAAAAATGRAVADLAADAGSAAERLRYSAEAFARLGYRLTAARTLLIAGRALTRARRRGQAAEVLTLAQAEFSAMHAAGWDREAGRQLDRVAPGRGTGTLTAAERRIAGEVAAGRRNQDIAAALFISVPTVEAHLTRIYRKVGVRSRTELASRLHSGRLTSG